MDVIERQAWCNIVKTLGSVVGVLGACWGWYEIWAWLAETIIKTPSPRFDAVWFALASVVTPILVWRGFAEWHSNEVRRLINESSDIYDEL